MTGAIELLPENGVRFQRPGIGIDLGGIAKGFAVDRAVETLKRLGVLGGVVNAGGDLAVCEGVIEGLYRFDGGEVIRTSSTFDAGASGGGLFDEEGALVGFLAFKARSGARLHFALPADWALPGSMVSSLLGPVDVTNDRVAFWQQPRASQPAFLGHAMLEAASQR